MIRLFCSDFDGTLGRRGRISSVNIAAIRQLQKTGCAFALVSGRPAGNALYLMRHYGIRAHIIASNGAVVLREGEDLLQMQTIPTDALLDILSFARERNWFYLAYETDRALLNIARLVANAPIRGLVSRFTGMHLESARQSFVAGWRVTKLNLYPKGMKQDDLIARLSQDPRLYVTKSSSNKVEISAAGVSKWAGIQTLAKHLEIAPQEIATIGDYDNDVSMLKEAGRSFAMGNAQRTAKEAADEVVAAVSQHGVSEAIGRVLLANAGKE